MRDSEIIQKRDDDNILREYFVTFRLIFRNLYFWLAYVYSQEEYSPEDPANPCANYPTEEYSSYSDCDDDFVRRALPPGLKPFWTVDNISEATNTFSMNMKRQMIAHYKSGIENLGYSN